MRIALSSTRGLSIPACLFSCLLGTTASAEKRQDQHYRLGTVPLVMREYMRELNCAPVRDFYEAASEHSEHIHQGPPFVKIGGGDFIFVCERPLEGDEIEYYLVVKADQKEHPFSSCSGVIHLSSVKPGGLFVSKWKVPEDQWDLFGKIESKRHVREQPPRTTLRDNISAQWVPAGGEFLILYEEGRYQTNYHLCFQGDWYFLWRGID